jgi:hypothetical protein
MTFLFHFSESRFFLMLFALASAHIYSVTLDVQSVTDVKCLLSHCNNSCDILKNFSKFRPYKISLKSPVLLEILHAWMDRNVTISGGEVRQIFLTKALKFKNKNNPHLNK